MDILDHLGERGLVAACSEPIEGLRTLLSQPATLYFGIDPTATSLHGGHLASIMVLHHLQRAGHQVILLIGGATARVGDPTGRSATRRQMPAREVVANARAICSQLGALGLVDITGSDPEIKPALVVDNADWLNHMHLGRYLHEVTVHFKVNQLVKHETFARRLDHPGEGLSLHEFLYPTLQALDFVHLCETYGCRLQIGGADQWRNILDGVELVRRMLHEDVYGLVFPLLTDREGIKMGKDTEGDTVWLDARRTSPWAFYQYWLRRPDSDVPRLLKMLTLLTVDDCERIITGHPREAQRRLALEVTALVHGAQVAEQIARDARRISASQLPSSAQVPAFRVTAMDLAQGLTVARALKRAGVFSLSKARGLIRQGAVRLNGARLEQDATLDAACFSDVVGERCAVLEYGRGRALRLVLSDQP